PIPGLRESGYLTNETVFSLINLPRRLAVIGGGPIGCELAQAFARFGARVHLVQMSGRLLAREDGDAARLARAALERDGVRLAMDTRVVKVERGAGGKVLHLASANDVKAGGGASAVEPL